MCRAAIGTIFGTRHETHVAGFIIAIIVDAVNLESRFIYWLKVGNKIFNVKPPLTNRNTASAVVRISRMVRVDTSVKDMTMPVVERVFGESVSARALKTNATASNDQSAQ